MSDWIFSDALFFSPRLSQRSAAMAPVGLTSRERNLGLIVPLYKYPSPASYTEEARHSCFFGGKCGSAGYL